MRLETLLLSADIETIRVVGRVMQDAGIDLLLTSTVNDAADLLARRKFDAFIADCDDLAGADDLVQQLRQGASNRSAIIFALTNGATNLRRAFALGANFVLEKPLTLERATRGMRAALGLMIRERRRYFRLPLELPATLDFGQGVRYQFTTTNLSEGGSSVRASHKLPVGARVRMSLPLPGGPAFECAAQIAWSTDEGRAGLRFLLLPQPARQRLAEFIARSIRYDDTVPLARTNGNGHVNGHVAAKAPA
jgi:CheY-like chemotaxis protein